MRNERLFFVTKKQSTEWVVFLEGLLQIQSIQNISLKYENKSFWHAAGSS